MQLLAKAAEYPELSGMAALIFLAILVSILTYTRNSGHGIEKRIKLASERRKTEREAEK